ncbi:MAG: cation diffusion facilitator family transporter [Chitinophagales bacterium]|nr:cation transporter [Bacteroidota bacterium]
MSHDHHHHQTAYDFSKVNKAFSIGIALNLFIVVAQVAVGLYIHSLSLLSDAGHNFADVASLILSFFAFKIIKVKSTEKYTYGYKKTSILVAFANALILLFTVIFIVYEAFLRLFNPVEIPGLTVAIIGFIAMILNGVSAYLFHADKEKDLNVKGAFLHLAADALVSAGIVLGGIIIYFTHLYWIDAVLSILIAIFILVSTWSLLTDSLALVLEGVPKNINIETIKAKALSIPGIKDIHHIHIWAISTTENAMTAHITLENNMNAQEEQNIKKTLKHELMHLQIHHITLETEREAHRCEDEVC